MEEKKTELPVEGKLLNQVQMTLTVLKRVSVHKK